MRLSHFFGLVVLAATIPAGTSGVTEWVQAMDLTNCQLSNGATMTIGWANL